MRTTLAAIILVYSCIIAHYFLLQKLDCGNISKSLSGLDSLIRQWKIKPYIDIEILPKGGNSQKCGERGYSAVTGSSESDRYEVCGRRSDLSYLELRQNGFGSGPNHCPQGTISCSGKGEVCVKTILDCPIMNLNFGA